MSELDSPSDGKLANDFLSIPDRSLESISDRVNPNQVASGKTRGVQYLGSDKVYSDGGKQQIIVEDDTVPRVMMGNHPKFGEGFYVSKPGINIKDTIDSASLVFNSAQNALKVIQVGTIPGPTVNFSTAANSYNQQTSIVSINHNLGFAPIVLAFLQSGLFNVPLPWMYRPTVDPTGFMEIQYEAYTNTTLVGFKATAFGYNSSVSGVFTSGSIKYYLLQETASN